MSNLLLLLKSTSAFEDIYFTNLFNDKKLKFLRPKITKKSYESASRGFVNLNRGKGSSRQIFLTIFHWRRSQRRDIFRTLFLGESFSLELYQFL